MGGNTLVMQLCTYSSCMLYHWLMVVYLDSIILTSDGELLLVLAASGFTDNS